MSIVPPSAERGCKLNQNEPVITKDQKIENLPYDDVQGGFLRLPQGRLPGALKTKQILKEYPLDAKTKHIKGTKITDSV